MTLSWCFLPASLISLISVSASLLASSSACLLPWVCCRWTVGCQRISLLSWQAGNDEPWTQMPCTRPPSQPCRLLSPSWPRRGPPLLSLCGLYIVRRMVNAENGPLEDWVISSEGFADTAGYGV